LVWFAAAHMRFESNAPAGDGPEEALMRTLTPEVEYLIQQPAMQQKILSRAAELVATGWTRGTAARDAQGQPVRSTAPQAAAWCVVSAIDRALYELLGLEVYEMLGLDVDGYDTAPCTLAIVRELRRPLQRVMGRPDLAIWNDVVCPGPAVAERLLRNAAEIVGRRISRNR
jgi:hypothetical protein